MTLLASPGITDEQLCARYGLTPPEARAVIDTFGHQADDHCALVAKRLRDELAILTGTRAVQAGCNIPALTMAKDEAVKALMFSAKPEHHRGL